MQQVLFWIPIKTALTPNGIPIYGFGLMLFLSFVAAMWLVSWRARREGIEKERLLDLALWVFIGGIIGARIVFMIQYDVPLRDWYKFWQGGIVFYGSAIGGWLGYALAWFIWFRKYRISTMKIADIVAPAVCIGLMIGRVGCLLNGCCYGHVCIEADAKCLRYPTLTAPARELVVNQGLQLTAGFALDEMEAGRDGLGNAVVGAVEPVSAAAAAGLRRGDIIVAVNDHTVDNARRLENYLLDWPRGEKRLNLMVARGIERIAVEFTPRTLPLHPTQIYESISMFFLFFVLMAFFPYRRHYGQVFVVLMLGYAIHRFFNETLRNDTDPILLNLTLSQVGSLLVFAAGLGLELYLRRFSEKVPAAPPVPDKDKAGA